MSMEVADRQPVSQAAQEFKQQIAELRRLAQTTSSAAEAREIISRIAQISRKFRIQNAIGSSRSPVDLAQEIDPNYVSRPHLEFLNQKIVSAVREVERGHNQQLAVSMPPRAGKSTMTSLHSPLWILQRHPEWSVVMTSYDGALTGAWAREIRRVIEDRPNLGVALKRDGGAGGYWETIEGGGMYTTGIGGALTGRGAKVMIIDDPIADFVSAHSPRIRQNLWNWWLSVAQTRLEPPYLVLTVMTRWHEDDFVGRLLSTEYEGRPDDWTQIVLPAIADNSDDILGRREGDPLYTPLLEETREQAIRRWDDVKSAVGTYTWCTPAETPILMADWSYKPIAEVRAGDLVMGFEKGSSDARMTFKPSMVQEVGTRVAPVQKMIMASGNTVRCTPTHRWYTGRGGTEIDRRNGKETVRERPAYKPAKVGSSLLRFAPDLPFHTHERQRDIDWISGILDGDGSFKHDSAIRIAQSPEANAAVFQRIGEVLDRLGWEYDLRRSTPSNENWSERGQYVLRDPRKVIHDLMAHSELAKWEQALAMAWRRPHKPTRYRDKVLEIIPEREEQVYALQTETGNYVAWGYASSNSGMYQQRPAPQQGAIFDMSWWRYWTVDPSKATADGQVRYMGQGSFGPGQWVDSWDCTFKGASDSGDFVVGQRWVRQQADCFLIAQKRERWTFTQTIDQMKEWAKVDNPMQSPYGQHVHQRLVENTANGPAILDVLQRTIDGLKAVNPHASKEARARSVTPGIESGNVYLPHPTDPGNEWVQDLLSELRNFPFDAHDDQVDALTQALAFLRGVGTGQVTVPGANPKNPKLTRIPSSINRTVSNPLVNRPRF